MKKWVLLFWWFVIMSDTGHIKEIGPFLFLEDFYPDRGCKVAQKKVKKPASVIIPCFFKLDPMPEGSTLD